MSTELDRLARFYMALTGEDRPGDETCDLCGRELQWRLET